jgi:transcription termination factor NusB
MKMKKKDNRMEKILERALRNLKNKPSKKNAPTIRRIPAKMNSQFDNPLKMAERIKSKKKTLATSVKQPERLNPVEFALLRVVGLIISVISCR